MSSLFDDLSLPDAFRRLDGVRVGPADAPAPVDPAGADSGAWDEEPPPEDDLPPEHLEPEEESPFARDVPPAPARSWGAADPSALAELTLCIRSS